MKNQEKIDFVITWVDGNDPVWQADKAKYVPVEMTKKDDMAGSARYADNGLLKYIFRGFEKFSPWVNKIYFVTYGHLPSFLNTENEKLVIVNHKDFLLDEYRPTFNDLPLNLNFHRIKGISNNFVYFNDDMFLLRPVKPELFFKNDLPRDMAVQDVIPAKEYNNMYYYRVFNDITMLNKTVNKKQVIKKNYFKWINLKYGKQIFKNIFLNPLTLFSGIYESHMPASYQKSTYEEVWEMYPEILDGASHHRVRSSTDISENFIRYYQMAKGEFVPINKLKHGRYCTMKGGNLPSIIRSQKLDYICINDNGSEENRIDVAKAFDEILPEKSSFEK